MGVSSTTKGISILALGRAQSAAFSSIAHTLRSVGKISYRDEHTFRRPADCIEFIRASAYDAVILPNPYGNLQRLSIYQLLRQARMPVVVFDRGGLPRSWFFDVGFNADSPSYLPRQWDRPIDIRERAWVRDYIKRVHSELAPLEAQGQRIGANCLRQKLAIGDRKVLFVPLQRPTDTTVRYFCSPMRDLIEFEGLVSGVEELTRTTLRDWVVVAKKHPLETSRPPLPVRFVDDDAHINDLIELADALLVLNSGTGLLSLCWDKPVLIAGSAYYAHPRLNRPVASASEIKDALLEPLPVDGETRDRFIHHLTSSVYSFGTFRTELAKQPGGGFRNITHHIDFDVVRFPVIKKQIPLLYVTSVIPWPITRGAAHRTDQTLRALLDQNLAVDLLCLNQTEPTTSNASIAARLMARYPSLRHIVIHRHPKLARSIRGRDVFDRMHYQLALLSDRVNGRAHTINCAAHCPPSFGRMLNARLATVSYSAIWFNYLRVLPPHLVTDAKVVCDLHDYQTERIKTDVLPTVAASHRDRYLRRFRESECKALARCDLAIAISPVEMQRIIDDLKPRALMACLPATDDVHELASENEIADLLFVGSRSDANLVGIVWFLERCFPLIKATLPDVRLRIHGSIVSSLRLQQLASQFLNSRTLILTGTAEDMDEVYASAKVVICPLRHGTGMKIKMVEAMAYGKAIVATSKATEGIATDLGVECFDAPEAFAAACVHLLNDEEAFTRTRHSAQATFARDHDHARLGEKLAGLLRQLDIQ